MKLLLAIGLGSFFGGILRYLLSLVIQAKTMSVFPYGTLAVNVIGCLQDKGIIPGLMNRESINANYRY